MRNSIVLLSLFISILSFADAYPVIRQANPFIGSRYFVPNDQSKHTSIVMLHGSEGGSAPYIDAEANILAMQGHSVLVLCYFDCNRGLTGPRQTLKNIEATIVLDAVGWLRHQPQSDGKVVVYGFSRGAELAMIVGSLDFSKSNRPSALIAHSPSDVFNGPWNWSWREPACWLCKAGVGKCSASTAHSDFQWNPSCGPDDPNQIDQSKSAWLVLGVSVPINHQIKIEKYDGPILITVGEEDEVWPVDQTRRLEATLKKAGRTPEIHYFPNGSHGFKGEDEITRREFVLEFLKHMPKAM